MDKNGEGYEKSTKKYCAQVKIFEIVERLLYFGSLDLQEQFTRHVEMTSTECILFCELVTEELKKRSMCLRLSMSITIVGDLHGQFHDLLRILHSVGLPPKKTYLFLGDYIDRGRYSLEVIMLLFGLFLKYPDNMNLLRGNHEATNVCLRYGFFEEIQGRFGNEDGKLVMKAFCSCFNWLPICAIIDSEIFCCHGGASPFFEVKPFVENNYDPSPEKIIDIINNIMRPMEPPPCGLMCDLLWADPVSDSPTPTTYYRCKDQEKVYWTKNSVRSCSFMFSTEALLAMLDKFKLKMMIRAHQVVDEGYHFSCNNRCLTIFSAPGYYGSNDNIGAVLQLSENYRNFDPKVNAYHCPAQCFKFKPLPNRPIKKLFWSD